MHKSLYHSELEILKQLFSTLSDDDKKSFLKSIQSKEQIAKKLHFTKDVKECPRCQSSHFVKNGKTQWTKNYGFEFKSSISFLLISWIKSTLFIDNSIILSNNSKMYFPPA